MGNTSKRGFASMEGEKQRVIASKGGRAAHAKGTAHEWSSDEARAAGRKGGESRGARGRNDNAAGITGVGNSYSEHELASSFLTNAGRSLRAPGANVQPVHSGNVDSNAVVTYATNTRVAYAGNAHAENQTA
jgi:uncharacterized protein